MHKFHWLGAAIGCFLSSFVNLYLWGSKDEDGLSFAVSLLCALLGAGLYEGFRRVKNRRRTAAPQPPMEAEYRVWLCLFGAIVVPFLTMLVAAHVAHRFYSVSYMPSYLAYGTLGICYGVGLSSIAYLPVHWGWRIAAAIFYLPTVLFTFFVIGIAVEPFC